MAAAAQQILIFSLAEERYGLALHSVQEIAPRVRVSVLADAPRVVKGLVRYRGEIAVAIDLDVRFGRPPREDSIDDHFIVVRTGRRLVVLIVDRVIEVRSIAPETIVPPPIDSRHVRGVVEIEDGIVFIQDLEAVLSLDEEQALQSSLASGPAP